MVHNVKSYFETHNAVEADNGPKPQSNSNSSPKRKKTLSSFLKTHATGVKVIRIEIYDASQFSNLEKSICKCNAELCAQHVVEDIYSDNVYIKIRDLLKSMNNSLYVSL